MPCLLALLCCVVHYCTTQLHKFDLLCAGVSLSLSSSTLAWSAWSVIGACVLAPFSKASQTVSDDMHGAAIFGLTVCSTDTTDRH